MTRNEVLRPGSVVFYRGRNEYVMADVTEVYISVYGDVMARMVDQRTDREYVVAVDWITHRPDFEVTA